MKKSPRVLVKCKNCSKEFFTQERKSRQHIFCSVNCYRENWKKRIPGWNKGLKTGWIPWNIGRKYELGPRPESRGIRRSRDTEFKYKNGSGAYVVLHNWVRRNLGEARRCDICASKDKSMYHWANRSGEYKKEPSDWMRLCVACHKKFDISRNWSLYKEFYDRYSKT